MAVLKKGSKGSAVKDLQVMLNKAGAKPKLATDGVYGGGTAAAVTNFQKKNKLKADGVAGEKTLAALKSGGAPRPKGWPYFDFVDMHKDAVAEAKKLGKEFDDLMDGAGGRARELKGAHDDWTKATEESLKNLEGLAEAQQKFLKLEPKDPAGADKVAEDARKEVNRVSKLKITQTDAAAALRKLAGEIGAATKG